MKLNPRRIDLNRLTGVKERYEIRIPVEYPEHLRHKMFANVVRALKYPEHAYTLLCRYPESKRMANLLVQMDFLLKVLKPQREAGHLLDAVEEIVTEAERKLKDVWEQAKREEFLGKATEVVFGIDRNENKS